MTKTIKPLYEVFNFNRALLLVVCLFLFQGCASDRFFQQCNREGMQCVGLEYFERDGDVLGPPILGDGAASRYGAYIVGNAEDIDYQLLIEALVIELQELKQ